MITHTEDTGRTYYPGTSPRSIAAAVQALEDARRRRGEGATTKRSRKRLEPPNVSEAFKRAAVQEAELRRLRASGVKYACLAYDPERLSLTTPMEVNHGEDER